jgi:Ca2+-binding EF-hand superfamily protein
MNTLPPSPTTHDVRGSVALLKSALKAADANNDGRITNAELGQAVRQAEGGRKHVYRGILLGKVFVDGFDRKAGNASLKSMQSRLERLGTYLTAADSNHNNRVSYSETVDMRKKDSTNRAYEASVLWNVARGT